MIILGYSVILDFFFFSYLVCKSTKKTATDKIYCDSFATYLVFCTIAGAFQMKTKLSVFSHFKL